MTAIDFVLPGAKIRSAWGNNVATEINQLRSFVYPVSVPAGMPWHVGPQIAGADGWSFLPASVGSEVMGYRGAAAVTFKYAWATRMLVGSTPSDAIGAKGILTVTGGKLAMDGNNTISWPDWSGNLWMQDATYLRWDKSIYMATGILATDGTFGVKVGASITGGYVVDVLGASRLRGLVNSDFATAFHPTWSAIHFRATSVTGDAGMTAWSSSQAPMFTAIPGNGVGESWWAMNNADSATIAIYASAFTVSSTERVKDDISPVRVLDKISQLSTKRYKLRVRPQSLRPTEKFVDIDQRWQSRGKSALVPRPQDHASHDHDCAIDGHCNGDADNPCSIAVNDTHEFGLVAEDVYEVFPEAVRVDKDFVPYGIDINQLTGIAIGGISEMVGKIKALEERIKQLEAV